ncbi:PrgI family protein [Lentzea sp. NPDC006480]|uniref:PrgI family protein n=1 Tax=Lentzea sp. NPDC006480 TaxID=3157176 RepID=UPI0033BD998E
MSQVRIPADVDREDQVLAGLTSRQVAILAVVGLVLYVAYTATRDVVPVGVFGAVALPVAAASAVLALGRRDGLSFDRLVLAAVRQRLRPRLQLAAMDDAQPVPSWLAHASASDVHNGDGPVQLPAESVTEAGVVDLGDDGLAVVAVCSTINFALRTATEQESLVASFGRYLHSLTAPVQVLIRTERLDLSEQIAELREQASGLPHPALENAALEFSDYLQQLSTSTTLLRRQLLLVLREPGLSTLVTRRGKMRLSDADRAAVEGRLARRLGEATELLGAAGIAVRPLDSGQTTSVLAATCNPDNLIPPTVGLAGADDIITVEAGWSA